MQKRMMNASNYIGLSPIFWLLKRDKGDGTELVHHNKQALALSFLFLGCFLIFFVSFVLHQIILFLSRELFKKILLEISFYIFGVFLLAWIILWLWGIVNAVRNDISPIPLTTRIVKNKKLLLISVGWTIYLQIATIALVGLAIHSVKVSHSESQISKAYMLYDDMGYIPEWVFSLGFYRVSLAANKLWGDDSVTIAPLTEKNLNNALENGVMIYIASHGSDGRIFLKDEIPYWPKDIDQSEVGEQLQYVYMAGCDTGFLKSEWESVFSPAKVKTFSRLSAASEHIIWLLFEGPKIISLLE